jgi:predicted RNA binding protein YcfA (HicA-like mRNA interferase family)
LTQWPSVKARHVLKALLKNGWSLVSQTGSHKKLRYKDFSYPLYVWAFNDSDELGSKILSRISKHTGLTPDDL